MIDVGRSENQSLLRWASKSVALDFDANFVSN